MISDEDICLSLGHQRRIAVEGKNALNRRPARYRKNRLSSFLLKQFRGEEDLAISFLAAKPRNKTEILTSLHQEYYDLQRKLTRCKGYVARDQLNSITQQLDFLKGLGGPFYFTHLGTILSLAKRFSGYPIRERDWVSLIQQWLRQFATNEQRRLALTLLGAVEMVFLDDISRGFRSQYSKLASRGIQIVIPQLVSPENSSPAMTYFYSKAVEAITATSTQIHTSSTVKKLVGGKEISGKHLLFVDDIIGSGTQQMNVFKELLNDKERRHNSKYVSAKDRLSGRELERFRNVKGYLLVYHATQFGKERVEKFFRQMKLNIEILVGSGRILQKCFDDNECPKGNVLFEEPRDLRKAKDMCKKIGYDILDGEFKNDDTRALASLGFGNSQQLVVFFHKPPNNTLPILWRQASNRGIQWFPLFPPPSTIDLKSQDSK